MRYRITAAFGAAALSLAHASPALAQTQSFNTDRATLALSSAPPPTQTASFQPGASTAVAIGVSNSAPAYSRSYSFNSATRKAALHWEVSYLALSAIDLAETMHCLNRGKCVEGNPIFGKHPSTTKLIVGKVGLGLVHFAVFDRVRDRNPKAALRLAQISAGVQGSAVLLNARFVLR